jgi:hypothetical protein
MRKLYWLPHFFGHYLIELIDRFVSLKLTEEGGKMLASDQVRDYVKRFYLEPARNEGKELLRVKTGDVHTNLGWNGQLNRFPIICQALETRRFLRENDLELVKRDGPPSGRSSTVVYTFRLRERAGRENSAGIDVMTLRGLGRSWLKAAGGGEAYLRKEREGFEAGGGAR